MAVAFLQETLWIGSRFRFIENGGKPIYTDGTRGENGVTVVLYEELQDTTLEVKLWG